MQKKRLFCQYTYGFKRFCCEKPWVAHKLVVQNSAIKILNKKRGFNEKRRFLFEE